MDFPQTQTSGLKIIYVSNKEVYLRTKSAYQCIEINSSPVDISSCRYNQPVHNNDIARCMMSWRRDEKTK